MIEIKLYCLYLKHKDSAHNSSIKGMQAIPCTGYQGKSGMLGQGQQLVVYSISVVLNEE